MAGRIKGITIEIGGDTTKLNSALKKTDGQLKTTRTNLKDINKLLKMDPGNTVLLEQKQRNLSKAIGDTKTRLDTLRKAEEQMRGTDMTAEQREQYEALQREIISTETDLKRLDNQMKEFGSVGAQQIAVMGEKLEQTGGKIKAAGEAISNAGQKLLPVTGAIVGAGAAAVKSWKEVDAAYDDVIRRTGATGDALTELTGIVDDLATSIPTSFETAGAAVGEINTRFDITGDELKNLSERFIKFADLNNTDVSGSIDTIQKAMAAWGVETENAGDYLDALNTAGQKTGVAVLTIAQSAATNAAQLKELGFSAADAALFLGGLEKNGVDASAAMTGLKKAYTNAIKEGGSLSDSLADLEKRLQNENTHAEAAAEAIELFGSRAGGAITEAVSTGRLSFEALGAELTAFSGNVENTFKATLDPLDEVKTTLNELKTTGSELVNAAGPMIKDVLGKANAEVKNLTGWIKNLSDEEKQTIIKTAGVVAAAGPALVVLGKTVSGVGSLVTGVGKIMKYAPKIVSTIKGVKAAQLGLNAASMATGGAVAAVAAGFALLIKHHQDYIKETYGLTEAQKEANAAIHAAVEETRAQEQARREAIAGADSEINQYTRLWTELQNLVDQNGKVKEGYESRAAVIAGILNDALGTEIDLTDGAISNYKELTDSMDALIEKKRAMAYLDANQGAYEDALKGIGQAQTDYYASISETTAAYDKLTAAQKALAAAEKASNPKSAGYLGQVANIMHLASAVAEAQKAYDEQKKAQDEAAESYYTLKNTIGNAEALMVAAESGENLSEAMNNVAQGFVTAENATQAMLDQQVADLEASYNAMKTAAENGAADVTAAELRELKRMVDAAKAEAAKGGVDAGTAYAEGMRSEQGDAAAAGADIKNAAEGGMGNDQYNAGYTRGSNYGLGLVNGLEAHYDRVRNAALRVAGAIPKETSIALQERSPSRLADRIGRYWDEGLIGGMEKGIGAVQRTATAVAGSMIVSPNAPTAMMRYPEAAGQNITVTAAAAPSDGAVNRALDIIINRLGNLSVGIRNAGAVMDTVTDYANRRMGRISTLEAEGVI